MSDKATSGNEYGDQAWRDESVLRELYVGRNMTVREVGEKLGCSRNCVSEWLEKTGVGARPQGHKRDLAGRNVDEFPHRDRERMQELYVERGLTTYEVAKELGCWSTQVGRWLKRHGIETRPSPVEENPDLPPELADADILRRLYTEQKLHTTEIAEMLDCGSTTVADWLARHGIDRRPYTELMSGEDNPMWKDGRWADEHTPYGEGWTYRKKENVRERDGHECRMCGMTDTKHVEQHGHKLHVHHLNKAGGGDNDAERNAEENLATLCRKCHSTAETMAPLLPELGR